MMATSQRSKEEQARRHAAGMEAVLVDLLALVDPLAFAERVLAETASR